jgi:hypothetical protein
VYSLPHDPGAIREPGVEHTEQALRLADVAIARTLVLEILAGELVEEADLAEHRADPRHLEHQPLQRLVALVRQEKLAALFGEVEKDRAGFEQRQRLSARTARIDDRRDLAVRVERAEFRRVLVVVSKLDAVRLVRQPVSSSRIETFTPFGVGSE